MPSQCATASIASFVKHKTAMHCSWVHAWLGREEGPKSRDIPCELRISQVGFDDRQVSDMDGLADIRVRFTPGKPFLPFQQLLAVLPAASCRLLPKPFEARCRPARLQCIIPWLRYCQAASNAAGGVGRACRPALHKCLLQNLTKAGQARRC